MLSTDEKMRLTLDLAVEAMDNGECPIAAIVFLNDEIVAKSYTKEFAEKRLLVHAELNALIEVDKNQYTYQDRTNMQLFTNLEPCMMCMGAAMSCSIGEIYYALESPSDGAVHLVQDWDSGSDYFTTYKVPKITGGILREESKTLFKQFASICENNGLKLFAQELANM